MVSLSKYPTHPKKVLYLAVSACLRPMLTTTSTTKPFPVIGLVISSSHMGQHGHRWIRLVEWFCLSRFEGSICRFLCRVVHLDYPPQENGFWVGFCLSDDPSNPIRWLMVVLVGRIASPSCVPRACVSCACRALVRFFYNNSFIIINFNNIINLFILII